MTTLGDRLKIARERKGYTQVQVKERTNINNKTLSGYEKNVSEPDTKTLSLLADLYEVSYRWLLTGKGDINETKFDPLEEIRKITEELGIDDLFFYDIEQWKNFTKEDVEELRSHFEYIAHKAKMRNKDR